MIVNLLHTSDGARDAPHVEYPDKWAIPLLAASIGLLMVVYGHRIPFGTLLWAKGFYFSVIPSVACAYFTMRIVSGGARYLDKRLPWRSYFWKRLAAQAIGGLLIPAVFALGWNLLYFVFRKVPARIFDYLVQDLPFVVVLLLLLNAFYIRYYYWKVPRQAAGAEQGAAAVPDIPPAVPDQTDHSLPPLPLAAYYQSEGKVTMAYWEEGTRTIDTRTIRELQAELNTHQFFSIRKGAIIRRDMIAAAKPIGRHYRITLRRPYERVVFLTSKARTGAFLDWYQT
ncbi:hypothetical protein [Parapedobacter sp. DT-150]|uniref:hypothetical protein n=1 Tax=Parapedobacter sp. DT-150 TaxID=3396162 RepID=UPI003F1DD224